MTPPGPPATPRQVRRRRRLAALALVTVAVLVTGLALVLGAGGRSQTYQLGGVGPPTVLPTPTVARGVTVGAARARHVPFTPAPRALVLAGSIGLDRQVAQLFLVALSGPAGSAVTALGAPGWGGVVFGPPSFHNDAQVAALAKAAQQAVRHATPIAPLLAVPQEGGDANVLPDAPPESEATIGAAGDPARARSQALLAGRRLRALGFNMTLAPRADVDTAGGSFGGRLYSTDPATVAALSDAAVAGYTAAGIISAPGHFPGAGAASADPDQMTATVGGSLAALRARDIVPFATVAPHAAVIQLSNAVYAALDGVTPATLLKPAVHLLRQDYGYEGVVLSDDLDAAIQATGGDAGAAAIQALQAGDDLLYLSGTPAEQRAAYAAVLAAAHHDATLRRRIYGATLRVLTLKLRFGITR